MPNIKSAIKRVSVGKRKAEENRGIKSEMLSCVRKFNAMIANGNVEEAKAEYSHVVSVVDGAAAKGIIKKENADRKKARLANALNRASK